MIQNFLILLFLTSTIHGQKLHHQMISAQGTTVHLSNGMIISQSIGQQSVSGNYNKKKSMIGQGYQQILNYQNNTPIDTTITYPNPISDYINFKFSSDISSPIKVTIMDLSGKIVFYQEKIPFKNILTIDNIQIVEGKYLVKLIGQNYNYSTKILKIK